MAGDTGGSGSAYGGAVEPCTVVLFGASGDLAKRKVIPAMYDLAIHNALGTHYVIVGFARTPMSEDAFRTTLGEAARASRKLGLSIRNGGTSSHPTSIIVPGITPTPNRTRSLPSASRNWILRRTLAATVFSTFPRRLKFIRTLSSSLAAPDSLAPPRRTPGCASSLRNPSGGIWHPPRP